jgi:hypothetical protein
MTLRALVPALLLLCSFSSYAQMGGPHFVHHYRDYGSLSDAGKRLWQRTTSGFYLRFSSLKFSAHYKDGTSGVPSLKRHVDTTVEQTIQSDPDGTFGFFSETFVPIVRMEDESMIAFDFGGFCEFFKFKVANIALAPGETPRSNDLVGFSGGLNLGLDYRIGADALLDKQTRTMFNIGAGISPGFFAAEYGAMPGEGAGGFSLQPYVKAEVGFFLGLAFKLRGDLLLGKARYIDAISEGEDDLLEVKATGAIRGARLGLGIMFYSWDWDGDY